MTSEGFSVDKLKKSPANPDGPTAAPTPGDWQPPPELPLDDPTDLLLVASRLGCQALYVPTEGRETAVNAQRSQHKLAVLNALSGPSAEIRLLAMSGYSYLAPRGTFFIALEAALRRGVRVEVVLEAAAVKNPVMTPKEIETRLAKLAQAHEGFRQLRRRYHNKLELREFPAPVPATMLITPQVCFFEPYIYPSAHIRESHLLVAFEMVFDTQIASHGHELMSKFFDLAFRRSAPTDDPTADDGAD